MSIIKEILAKKFFGEENVEYRKGGIYIKPSKRGSFTREAKKRNLSVQEFANRVLENKERYSPAMVKKAVFAKNAKKWKHEDGGSFIVDALGIGSQFVPQLQPVVTLFDLLNKKFGGDKYQRAPVVNYGDDYIYKHGGKMKKAAKYYEDGDFIQYNGPSHKNGGIDIDANGNPVKNPAKTIGEVEKEENLYFFDDVTGYIFSDNLVDKQTGKTFAQLAKDINRRIKGNDEISKNTKDAMLAALAKKNEAAKKLSDSNNKFENGDPFSKLFTTTPNDSLYTLAAILKGAPLIQSAVDALRKPEVQRPRLPNYSSGDKYYDNLNIDMTPLLNELERGTQATIQTVQNTTNSPSQMQNLAASAFAKAAASAANLKLSQQNALNQLSQLKGQREDTKQLRTAAELARTDDINAQNRAAARFATREFFNNLSKVGSSLDAIQFLKDKVKNENQLASMNAAFIAKMLDLVVPNFGLNLDMNKPLDQYTEEDWKNLEIIFKGSGKQQ